MTQLSEHFTLDELITTSHREFDNNPPPEVVDNLKRLAVLLEQVRTRLAVPLNVNSGYRSPQVNTAVGSKPTSQHILGCACDFHANGYTPDEVVQAIINSDIVFDQLIREFDSWTHISVPSTLQASPRGQILIIDRQGTRVYPQQRRT